MRRREVSPGHLVSAVFICVTSLVLTTQVATADACVDRISAQGRAATAKTLRLEAELKRTGNCSLVPAVLAGNDQFIALCNRMVSECGGWCKLPNSRASYEKRLRGYCSDTTVAAAKLPKIAKDAPTPQPVTIPSPQEQVTTSPANRTSCGSDITGTENGSPTSNASDCKDAHRSLNAARQLRKQKQFALLAPEEYKKAAAAAQRAGDTELMLKIIEEAQQPDAPTTDKPDPYKDGLVRSADAASSAAQEILSKPATCSDMKDAEALYLRAAKSFLDADESAKTDEMLRKHDVVAKTVDSLETQGKCKVQQASSKPSPAPSTNSDTDNNAKCQESLDRLKKLDEPTPNMASIGEQESPRPNYNVVVAKMKLAAEGCNIPNAQPYTVRECLAARIYMTQDGTPADSISGIVEHAGCAK